MNRIEDLKGNKYGELTVVSLIPKSESKATRWKCLCSCGNEKIALASGLKRGSATSCGCKRGERKVKTMGTHGKSYTSEYAAWKDMKRRCLNPNSPSYKNYGGRGITIQDDWIESFDAFYRDMGDKPKRSYSLDRIDNEKGYSKDNCRWTNKLTQDRNRRTTKLTKDDVLNIRNSSKKVSELANDYGVSRNHISNILSGLKWARCG